MHANVDNTNLEVALRPTVATLRLVVLAMAGGVLAFAVVAVVLQLFNPRQAGGDMLTSWVIYAVPMAIAMSWLVPAFVVKSARRQIASGAHRQQAGSSTLDALGDAGALLGVYQSKTILAAALLEGAAFFALVAFLLDGNWIALGLGLLVLVAIVALVPTTSRASGWLEQQQRLLHDEKQLAG